jgi:hypothetical protein
VLLVLQTLEVMVVIQCFHLLLVPAVVVAVDTTLVVLLTGELAAQAVAVQIMVQVVRGLLGKVMQEALALPGLITMAAVAAALELLDRPQLGLLAVLVVTVRHLQFLAHP